MITRARARGRRAGAASTQPFANLDGDDVGAGAAALLRGEARTSSHCQARAYTYTDAVGTPMLLLLLGVG